MNRSIHAKMMFSRDILLRVTSFCDNETLRTLSQTSLWNDIKIFSGDQFFWKMRVENLVGKTLLESADCWKKIYYILDPVLRGESFSLVDTSSSVAIKLLLDLGYEPTLSLLDRAIFNDHPETVKLLLEDRRVDPSIELEDGDVLEVACRNGQSGEVIELLISDGRIDTSSGIHLAEAAECDNAATVRLLLLDSRVDPRRKLYGSLPLSRASACGCTEAVRVLLADSRVDPSADDNYSIRGASSEGHEEVVKLLLADPRIILSSDTLILCCELAEASRQAGVLDLLIRDRRMNLDVLSLSRDFKRMLKLLFPHLERESRALGLYKYRYNSKSMPALYRSLILLIILRRITLEECLEWISLHPTEEPDLIFAFRSFPLLIGPEGDKIDLRDDEEASREAISLAYGLAGAFLGRRAYSGPKSTLNLNHSRIYEMLR